MTLDDYRPRPDMPPMEVYVPSGRIAKVLGITADRVRCQYVDDFEEVALLPKHLKPVIPVGGPRR